MTVDFAMPNKIIRALDNISLGVYEGEVLGIVGESGCGKSTMAASVMRLLSVPPANVDGQIWLQGRDLISISEKEMRAVRGNEASIVFQDPMISFNPGRKIGVQVGEPLDIHEKLSREEVKKKVIEVFRDVELPSPEIVYKSYPYELSGGMRQRAAIAMALITKPKLVIADEPTSSLDVTIQAQIIQLFSRLTRDYHMTLILITHDLGVAASICDRIAVMYAGTIVEVSSTDNIFHNLHHPYTAGLMRATPGSGRNKDLTDGILRTRFHLKPIPGETPDPSSLPSGCVFHPRCFLAKEICVSSNPLMREVDNGHYSACHFAEEVPAP